MRYGPIDLTPFGSVLSAIGVVYWLLALGALLWIWMSKNSAGGKVVLSLIVVALFGFLPGRAAWEGYQARQRLDESIALFKKRCETAGEKIYRTAENVEGVVWMKWRDKGEVSDDYDQYKLFDPYGRDCTGDECILKLVRVTEGHEKAPELAKRHSQGYSYVEYLDPTNGQWYRARGAIRATRHRTEEQRQQYIENSKVDPGLDIYDFVLSKEKIPNSSIRYGVTWDDISTREDRDHWIAGGRLKVVDLQTNEVMAERVGYMIDVGQGDKGGYRSPWRFAQDEACPEFPTIGSSDPRRRQSGAETRQFANKVVIPFKED